MFWTYVIKNPEGKIYIGQTNNIHRRLAEHNDSKFKGTLHTKRHRGPWTLIHSETFTSRSQAMKREKQLKSARGRMWIRTHLLKESQ